MTNQSKAGRAYLSEPGAQYDRVQRVRVAPTLAAKAEAARILADVEPSSTVRDAPCHADHGPVRSPSTSTWFHDGGTPMDRERKRSLPVVRLWPASRTRGWVLRQDVTWDMENALSESLSAALAAPDFVAYLAAQREQEASC